MDKKLFTFMESVASRPAPEPVAVKAGVFEKSPDAATMQPEVARSGSLLGKSRTLQFRSGSTGQQDTKPDPKAAQFSLPALQLPGAASAYFPLLVAGVIGAILALFATFVVSVLPYNSKVTPPEFVNEDILDHYRRGLSMRLIDLNEGSTALKFSSTKDNTQIDLDQHLGQWALIQKTAIRNSSIINTNGKSRIYFYKSGVQNMTFDGINEAGRIRAYHSMFRDLHFPEPVFFEKPKLYLNLLAKLFFEAPSFVTKASIHSSIFDGIYFEDGLSLEKFNVKNSVLHELAVQGRLRLNRLVVAGSSLQRLITRDVESNNLGLDNVDIKGLVLNGDLFAKDSVIKNSKLESMEFRSSVHLEELNAVASSFASVVFRGFLVMSPVSLSGAKLDGVTLEKGFVSKRVRLSNAHIHGFLSGGPVSVLESLAVSKSELSSLGFAGSTFLQSLSVISSTVDGALFQTNAKLKGCKISDSRIMSLVVKEGLFADGCSISKSTMHNFELRGKVAFLHSTMSGVTLKGIHIYELFKLTGMKMNNIELSSIQLAKNAILGMDYVEATNSRLENSTMEGFVLFEEAVLSRFVFKNIEFKDMVDFEDSTLNNVRFENVVFHDLAIFEGAKLHKCSFKNVVFKKPVKSRNAKLSKTTFEQTTFPRDGGFNKDF